MKFRIVLAALLLWSSICLAQQSDSDTTRVPPADSSRSMETTIVDTTAADTADKLPQDSLSEAERNKQDFQRRYEQYQQQREEALKAPTLSLFDTLITYFTSRRMNMYDQVNRSWYHNAGDYFRADPSYFVLDFQATPMRTTVQPFGLMGNRMNFVVGGHRLEPQEHVPESEGLIDLNAIPTALNHDIFLLPGPIGQLFGGTSAVASLVTRPLRPSDLDFHSAFMADQGGYEYDFTRGWLTKRFADGRTADAAVEYRNAEGTEFGRQSEHYSYYGDFYFPVLDNSGVRAWGYLYDMNGPLVTRPEAGGNGIFRDRFDREAEITFSNDSPDGSRRYEVGYHHRRHGAYSTSFSGALSNRLDWTGHEGSIRRNWQSGRGIFSISVDGAYMQFDTGSRNIERISGDVSFRMADLSDGWRYALTLNSGVVEDTPLLPGGSFSVFRDGERSMALVSVGLSSRAPSLLELYLPEDQAFLYGGTDGYGEIGNHGLYPESQLIGVGVLEWGSAGNSVNLSVAGGRILDGIEWRPLQESSALTRFSPINTNVDFFAATLTPKIQLNNILAWRGGASYRWINYEDNSDRVYTPDYQGFSGLELHLRWPQLGLDLFGYGELVYTGKYRGYQETELGQEVIPNAKLSFALNDFRMHFVFQNVLSTQYRQREYFTYPGRFFYLGIDWRFLN